LHKGSNREKPQSVTEWADHLRITDRQLRNLWHTGSGFSAKYILFIHNMLSSALDYYRVELFGSDEEKEQLETSSEEKLFSYFNAHQEIISFLFS
jgi:predicted peptidase